MYTIVRKTIGLPDYLNTYLGKEEDCFLFETEHEAKECLQLCFENGANINDEKHGMVRYFISEYEPRYTPIEY